MARSCTLFCLTVLTISANTANPLKSRPTFIPRINDGTFYNTTSIYYSHKSIFDSNIDFFKNATLRRGSRFIKDSYPSGNFSTAIVKGVISILQRNSISDSQYMQGLGLNGNEIEIIKPGAFRNLPALKYLILSDNKLSEINENVFNFMNIEQLYLINNSISSIQQRAFDNMPHLSGVYLTYNKISKWDSNWFSNTPYIKILDFNNNKIATLPVKAFKNFAKLRDLQIRLDFNNLRRISQKTFRDLEVHNLNLMVASNEIVKWDEGALDQVSLLYFDISDNKLRRLDGDFKKFFRAFYTDIDNNPWDCEFLRGVRRFASDFLGEHWVLMENVLKKCNIQDIELTS